MSLGGSIDDVSVVDVLQFIHMSGRTGRLLVKHQTGLAAVEFVNGNIVFARSPGSRPIGEILVEAGVVTSEELARLVTLQAGSDPRLPLGRLVVESGRIEADALAGHVREQIQAAVLELVGWTSGQFQFHQNAGDAPDDVKVDVEDVLPLVGMNTQFFLLEALRLVDERTKHVDTLVPAPVQASLDLPEASIRPSAARPDLDTASAPGGATGPVSPSVLTVGLDSGLLEIVRDSVRAIAARWRGHVPTREVEDALLGARAWPASLILIWRLRGPTTERERLLSLLAQVRQRHPGWTTVLLVTGGTDAVTAAYECGAQAVLPLSASTGAVDPALAAALRSVLHRACLDLAQQATAEARETRAWVEARRMTLGLTKALQHATVSLELMRVAAAVLDRAVLLLAKRRELVGLGAFGLTRDGQAMGDVMRGLTVPLADDSLAARALSEGRAIVGAPRSLGLGDVFFSVAGEPGANRAVLVPLIGPSKTIGLLYGDNGALAEPIRGVHAVELAAAHAGLAFENALLRRRLERTPASA